LWEGVREQEREYTLSELAAHYFGTASEIEQAAVMRALVGDRLYFRRRGLCFIPRSAEQVEQMRHQQRQHRERAAFKERVIQWLRDVVDAEGPVTVSEEWEDVLESVEDFLQRRQMSDIAHWLSEVDPRRTAREIAYEVLVKTGWWEETADFFLVLADLNPAFPARVREAAERLVPFAGASDRADFVGAWTVSIDDEETEEIDDAFSVEPGADGWRVGIHIADVAHYVRKGDVLDAEAFHRGVTVYLPTGRVLMFPERLAYDVASLRQGEVRPTLSLTLDVDEEGHIREARLVPGMIRVLRRLSYDEADRWIAEDEGEMGERLRRLLQWARRWADARFQRGAVWVRRPEMKVRVREGRIHVKRLDPGTPSRFLVSELMVLMNHLAAEQAVRQGIPIIFRVQDPPGALVPGKKAVPFFPPRGGPNALRGSAPGPPKRTRPRLNPLPLKRNGWRVVTCWKKSTLPKTSIRSVNPRVKFTGMRLMSMSPGSRSRLFQKTPQVHSPRRSVRTLNVPKSPVLDPPTSVGVAGAGALTC
jgi:exoribonuclease-2